MIKTEEQSSGERQIWNLLRRVGEWAGIKDTSTKRQKISGAEQLDIQKAIRKRERIWRCMMIKSAFSEIRLKEISS